MMPSLFVAHGAPSIVLEDNSYTRFLSSLSTEFPKPDGIVVFTAHWESTIQKIGAPDTFDTIYDFGGFSPELYKIKYPASGDAELAKEIQVLFQEQNIPSTIDQTRGLDHGAWTILQLLYPNADIPVVSLSVNRNLTPQEHYLIGKALSPLRKKNILIIGSGGTVHNLRRLRWEASDTEEWALSFDRWIEDRLVSWDTEGLFGYEQDAPYAKEAVPTNEHFVPLILAMGAGEPGNHATLLHRSYQYGSLSLRCWKFE